MQKIERLLEKYKIKYLWASDENKVCEKFGIWVEKSMYGKKYFGISRSTFIINDKGRIFKHWNKVKVFGHVKEVLEAAKNYT